LSDAPDQVRETGAAGNGEEPDASLRGLLTEATRSLSALLAAKLRLAEKEASENLATLLWAGGLIAVGMVLCLLGLGFVGIAAGILLERATGSALEAALIVTGAYFAAGLGAGTIAWFRMKRMSGLFRESREDLKRDLEWLKKLG